MKCVLCGGKIEKKKVTFIYDYDENYIVIKNVPAEICELCGERTYSPETTDRLIMFANNQFKPLKEIEIPLFDYSVKYAA
ncbi:YgiT-type zinc finger domain-containing protein [Candidatus Magnetomoraceae bacterium gMMP-15]